MRAAKASRARASSLMDASSQLDAKAQFGLLPPDHQRQLFDDTVDPTLLDSTTFTTLDTKIVGDLFDDEDDSSETDNN